MKGREPLTPSSPGPLPKKKAGKKNNPDFHAPAAGIQEFRENFFPLFQFPLIPSTAGSALCQPYLVRSPVVCASEDSSCPDRSIGLGSRIRSRLLLLLHPGVPIPASAPRFPTGPPGIAPFGIRGEPEPWASVRARRSPAAPMGEPGVGDPWGASWEALGASAVPEEQRIAWNCSSLRWPWLCVSVHPRPGSRWEREGAAAPGMCVIQSNSTIAGPRKRQFPLFPAQQQLFQHPFFPNNRMV